ncbi:MULTISPECIES: Arc family DNA-binding protein [unclassified Nocardia]|uniref:Arc family DNA-binding protein n=1 Tax=unclassified Nocardia TaxID=2637762 RepID=UPI0033BF3DA0
MTSLTVQLPDEVHAQLVTAAEADGLSMNAAVVTAVQEWLQSRAHRAQERARMQQVLAADPHLRALLGDD